MRELTEEDLLDEPEELQVVITDNGASLVNADDEKPRFVVTVEPDFDGPLHGNQDAAVGFALRLARVWNRSHGFSDHVRVS